MGPLYPQASDTRKAARKIAASIYAPVVVLPQTWTGPDHFQADFLYAREHRSLKDRPRAQLAPDLALAYRGEIEDVAPEAVGVFFRTDCEKRGQTPAANLGDPAKLANGKASHYVRLAASYQVLHTNRLHFAIAALLAGRGRATSSTQNGRQEQGHLRVVALWAKDAPGGTLSRGEIPPSPPRLNARYCHETQN